MVEPRIVYGENVLQALQYAESRNAQASLVALSLVIGGEGQHRLVPERLHSPLRQAAAVTARSRNPQAARRFLRFMLSPRGRNLLKKYGFGLPHARP
jgi:molybdate transport system substrate-binding protein